MYQNLFDSHTHSENSPDALHSVMFMLECAVEQDIQGFSITDHCECDLLEEQEFHIRLQQAAVDIALARAAFQNRVIVTHGIELGQPHLNYAGAEGILSDQAFDFVLLALHRMREWPDFYNMDYTEYSEADLHKMMQQYFQEMLELVRWGNFDSLAHLSLPLRYMKNRHQMEMDLFRYTDEIDEILRALAQSGKALEINTSGLRDELRDTMPPGWVVQRFRELGGERITLGSDAHSARHIGRGIRDAMHLLLEHGIEYFAFYRRREPIMLRII